MSLWKVERLEAGVLLEGLGQRRAGVVGDESCISAGRTLPYNPSPPLVQG